MAQEFEAVIGLEVHCQLSTNSKIFCGCRTRSEDGKSVGEIGPNANTCPVCSGHPGTLPVLNKKVVEYAIKAGLATNCTINLKNIFARKNYFYPDLPRGYQISQYDQPICEHGHLNIETQAGAKRVRIERIHMEEDAGKNVHMTGYSVVNLNRAGVPLVEIVSSPDMRTSEEAGAYLRALYAVVTYLGICDGNMQEGNFRCDANVSVMPKGAAKFGTRAEIKNVNSFRFVEKAIDFEITRQIDLVQSGGKVVQETRLYDSTKNATFSMRSKEEAHDYRYFPEPDLIPLKLEQAWVDQIKTTLPELPEQKRARFVKEYGLSADVAAVLTLSQATALGFSRTMEVIHVVEATKVLALAKPAANLFAGEITRLLNDDGIDFNQSKVTPEHIAEIAKMIDANELSSTGAKQVIGIAWKSGEKVSDIVDREGLKQVSDLGSIEPAVDAVLKANPAQVADFKAGKDKLIGFFVGQVMKATGGKANPGIIQELIKKKLS